MHKADKLPPSCAVVTKSGSLNFLLETSGPVQACNGTDLPFIRRIRSLLSTAVEEGDGIAHIKGSPDSSVGIVTRLCTGDLEFDSW